MTILMAVSMAMLLVFVALIIDTNWMASGYTDLQMTADHSARSALLHYASEDTTASDSDRLEAAVARGQQVFHANSIGGEHKTVGSDTIEFGRAVMQPDGKRQFTPDVEPYNSVRMKVDLANDSSGIGLLLGSMFKADNFEPRVESVVTAQRMDLVVALDVSRSMTYVTGGYNSYPPGGSLNDPPVAGARWFEMVDEAHNFLTKIATHNGLSRIGMVTFGGGLPPVNAPLFPNTKARQEYSLGNQAQTSQFITLLNYYATGTLGSGTSLADAVYASVKTFEDQPDPTAERVVILLSDGEQWFGSQASELDSPATAAQYALDHNVRIHTIYYSGPPTGEADLKSISQTTGGLFFDAANGTQLRTALTDLTKTLELQLLE